MDRIARFEKSGLFVEPGFLSPDELGLIRADLQATRDSQGFARAGTGKGAGREIRDQVRRDEIHWLERGESSPARDLLWSRIDQLQRALNRELYLGLRDFEGHYAVYPPGGFYKRHLDTFRGDPARTVSLILYLNPAWKEGDGGELRIYGADGISATDVQPIGGTLVCFLSREREHEVLTSHAERMSFTGWFKR